MALAVVEEVQVEVEAAAPEALLRMAPTAQDLAQQLAQDLAQQLAQDLQLANAAHQRRRAPRSRPDQASELGPGSRREVDSGPRDDCRTRPPEKVSAPPPHSCDWAAPPPGGVSIQFTAGPQKPSDPDPAPGDCPPRPGGSEISGPDDDDVGDLPLPLATLAKSLGEMFPGERWNKGFSMCATSKPPNCGRWHEQVPPKPPHWIPRQRWHSQREVGASPSPLPALADNDIAQPLPDKDMSALIDKDPWIMMSAEERSM